MAKKLSSIVRIFTPEWELAGTGLLISKERILTYTDVIVQALNLPDAGKAPGPKAQVTLDFPFVAPGETRTAKVIAWHPGPSKKTDKWGGENIAVLEMTEAMPDCPTYATVIAPDKAHYSDVIGAIADGRVVPFLGAGASLVGRPSGEPWLGKYPPSGGELAEYLAKRFKYAPSDMQDLLRVSQYVSIRLGSGALYDELRKLFNTDYPITPLHTFFAKLPAILRSKNYPQPYQLLVTTNYDDLLERAFESEQEPYDLLTYMADGESRGHFLHRRYNGSRPTDDMPDGRVGVITNTNDNRSITLKQRSVIVKIHGAVSRAESEWDSYVITEDHYIDYLTRTNISLLLPVALAEKLRNSHILFLGYGLKDWNLRVILHRIWNTQRLRYKSWAIQLNPLGLDEQFWGDRGVTMLNSDLNKYIKELDARVRAIKTL